jgi:hypothetical protein
MDSCLHVSLMGTALGSGNALTDFLNIVHCFFIEKQLFRDWSVCFPIAGDKD